MNIFIPWIGGKKALSSAIINKFPDTAMKRYVEVFGGAGWVLFKKEQQKGQIEVINDLNDNLINLYRCIKFHPEALEKELDGIWMARKLFTDFKHQLETGGLTDIQRAARYLYLIKYSFSSNTTSFATAKKNLNRSIDMFPDVQERLKDVIVENVDFQRLIKTYDRSDTLFYLDPPYYGSENYYSRNGTQEFSKDDHMRLSAVLHNIKGKFILSYNDDAFIRELYDDFNIETIERSMTLSAHAKDVIYKEVIITNY